MTWSSLETEHHRTSAANLMDVVRHMARVSSPRLVLCGLGDISTVAMIINMVVTPLFLFVML